MIAQYEAAEKAESLYSPGLYGLTQAHKHLPEMQKLCGLKKPPVFTPSWVTTTRAWLPQCPCTGVS